MAQYLNKITQTLRWIVLTFELFLRYLIYLLRFELLVCYFACPTSTSISMLIAVSFSISSSSASTCDSIGVMRAMS